MYTVEIGFIGEALMLIGVFTTVKAAIAAANDQLDDQGPDGRAWYRARVRQWDGTTHVTVWESVRAPRPTESK